MGISLNNNFVYYGMMMDIDSGLDDAFYVSDDAKDLAKRIAGVSNQADATRCMQEFDAIMAYCPIGYRISLYAFDDQLEVGPYVGGYRYDTFKWK
ncbi:MAG: hypothetical protein II689_04575, partial [Firmicutes bacterium]|nr:hypothetical protein [Bacillota bacterium]